MRPIHSLLPLWRHTLPAATVTATATRNISTGPGTFANLRYELLSRPPKCYYDYLTPTNSHLLAVTLADQVLPSATPTRDYTKPGSASSSSSSSSTPSSTSTTRPYPPPFSSDVDHWTLPKIHRGAGSLPAPPLPQGHHLVYFPPTHPSSALLADGTDADHWPGPPFTRRLWAGGAVSFAGGWERQLLLDKRRAACVERVEDVRLHWARQADGASDDVNHHPVGDKVFVDVVRRYGPVGADEDAVDGDEVLRRVEASPAIVERRTLVFLTGGDGGGSHQRPRGIKKPPKLYQDPSHVTPFTATQPILFRFSALSFNAHAIHLDRDAARSLEGHAEHPLLVHGPLLLALMLSALRSAALKIGKSPRAASRLEYMNLQPVYEGEQMRICVRPGRAARWHVWVEGEDGRLCVKGAAEMA